MPTLLEKYGARINLAEKYHAKVTGGETLSNEKKVMLATVLNTTEEFLDACNPHKLNEAFANGESAQTQRADMGTFKKFSIDVTTLTYPNLIGADLVVTKPIDSLTGYFTYREYVKASEKGQSHVGDLIASPFKIGNVDKNYTSSTVIENATVVDSKIVLGWGPVVPGSISFVADDKDYFDDGQGHLYKGDFQSKVYVNTEENDGVITGIAGRYVVTPAQDATIVGTVAYGSARSKSVTGAIYDNASPLITFTTAPTATSFKVNYTWNNAVIRNAYPKIGGVMRGISIEAKPRTISIEYSNLAKYQYQKEYGKDLLKEMETAAMSTLQYETDTEIVDLLTENATFDADLVFSTAQRVGVSLADHYDGFKVKVEIAKQKIYDLTRKYFANYMVCASSVVPVLTSIRGFVQANYKQVAGPYKAGTLDGMPVYVTPNIEPDTFFFGVNSGTLDATAAIFCPYMSLVPSALLELPDFSAQRGYATIYALKLLNKDLLIAGKLDRTAEVIGITGASN